MPEKSAKNRLLLFIPTSQSGVALYAANLAVALQKAQLAVELIAPRNFVFAEDVRRAGVRWHQIAAIVSRNAVITLLTMLVQIGQLGGIVVRSHLRTKRNSKVIVHVLTNYIGPLQLLLHVIIRVLGGRVVFTVHDVKPHYRVRRSVQVFNDWCFQASCSLANLLHVHNETQRAELEALQKGRGDRIIIIPHGANFERSVRGEVSRAQSEPLRLVVIGGIRANKQVVECIQAIKILHDSGVNAQLEIFGTASRLERPYLDKVRAAVLAAKGAVTFHERFVGEDEFDLILESVDAVILPYAEFTSQSGVALRAIQAECFIIGTASCAAGLPLGETLEVEICGTATSRDIADAIRRFVSVSPRERKMRIRTLREVAMRVHSWNKVAHQFLGAYERS